MGVNIKSLVKINSATKKEKIFYLEVMRVLAIFFVIFNHTQSKGFSLFTKVQPASPEFWVYVFLSIFCKFAVALFFMISGAIMLNKENEPLKKLWTKRILKMFVILLVFSFIYYLQKNWNNIQIQKFGTLLYTSGTRVHLWYLYSYIAYLICLPFLRSIVKNLDNKYFYYMIAIFFVFKAIIPIGEYLAASRKSQIKYKFNNNMAYGEYSFLSMSRIFFRT